MATIGVYYLISAIELHSSQSMELLSEQKTKELDTYFMGVERAVGVLEAYLMDNVNVEEYKSNSSYRRELFENLEDRARNSARIVENVEAVYFRPDASKYGGTSGFFLTAISEGEYKSVAPTDITAYKENDREHVGWYYEPIKKGSSLWMEPYSNENIDVYMISYVTPVYLGSEFLGVVGMDIDMTLVHQVIDTISHLNSTGALVSTEGNLLYHRDYSTGLLKENFTGELLAASYYFSDEYTDTNENYLYSYGSSNYRIMVNKLSNGMMLAISTPEAELFKLRTMFVVRLIIIFVIALVVVLFVSLSITKRIVVPIQELTMVSSRIAKGELGQEIHVQSNDEIGSLADSIRKISVELKEYIDYIHGQAYLDAMTGVKNKAAYIAEENRLERLIREKMASFTIYVFDVNGLKRMNDTKGHEYGDMMIKDAALMIRNSFETDRVFRIGGDEFVVFADAESEDDIRRQMARFDEELRIFNAENVKYDNELAISKGAAVYNADTDIDFAAVFGRADEEMYRCKELYYKKHGDRRRK
ncbi:MAG: diguanylate cyclase [Lachnospiraceae bacterium]|nr:diguanylate cyclase [Lachnospiraceae bacterium]